MTFSGEGGLEPLEFLMIDLIGFLIAFAASFFFLSGLSSTVTTIYFSSSSSLGDSTDDLKLLMVAIISLSLFCKSSFS